MNRRSWVRWLDSFSDNRKSKTCTELSRSIQNRKLVGIIDRFSEHAAELITAKQIGLTIPPNVLVRADRVIK